MMGLFLKMLDLSKEIGRAVDAQWYEDGAMFIRGSAADGRVFKLSVTFEEVKADE